MWVWRRFYADPAAAGGPAGDQAPAAEPAILAGIFRYSLPLFLISIGFLVLTEVDTLMLGLLASDFEVGQFAIAKQLANKLPQFALALSMGTMPGFARLTPDNLAAMRTKFNGVLRLNGLAFIPGGILLILLAPWLIPLVFGPEYGGAVLPLQILTVWLVLTSFNMFFNALLDYQGRASRRARNFLLTIVLTVGLNLVLIPRFGAVGAAVSTTVSFAPYVILNLIEVREIFRTIPKIGAPI
jgi:O-antigen/teichoic acid export membrane protein